MGRYLLAVPFVIVAAFAGWVIANMYFNRQMLEVCGMDIFESIVSPMAAYNCLVWSDSAEVRCTAQVLDPLGYPPVFATTLELYP